MFMLRHGFILASAVAWFAAMACPLDFRACQAATLTLDFNSGVDSVGSSAGVLVFNGPGGFSLTLDDDGSSASGSGVRITNQNPGNIKVGSSDLVVGALDTPTTTSHSSGIVATFSQGVDSVSLDDTDNDRTTKALFAFNSLGTLIGQTAHASQVSFSISTLDTGGQPIFSVEFDTAAGTAGGANDGTVFTMDNLSVSYTPVPEPSTLALAVLASLAAGLLVARRGSRPGCHDAKHT